jgi:hypothetical protein
MDEPEQAFVFDCVQSIKDRIPGEHREMIYSMAFRGMIKEFREGQAIRPYAMLYRSRTAALMNIRINRGLLVEIEQFFDWIEPVESAKIRRFYEDWLSSGDEHGISVRLSEELDLLELVSRLGIESC